MEHEVFVDIDMGYDTIIHTMKKGDEMYGGAYHEDEVGEYATLLKTCLDYALPTMQKFLDDHNKEFAAKQATEAAAKPVPDAAPVRQGKRSAIREAHETVRRNLWRKKMAIFL